MTDSTLSTMKKVAYFMILLGEEHTVKIFEYLPKDIIEQISQEIVQARNIDNDVALDILNEFYVLTKSHQHINSGGYDYAQEILFKAMDQKEAQRILEKLSTANKKHRAFIFLHKVNPKQLGEFLKDETAQTIAIVLAHMDSTSAAETLNSFKDSKKVQITHQMATIKDVSPEIIHTISAVLEEKLDLFTSSSVELGGVKVAADMLNRMTPTASKDILSNLSEHNDKITKEIKDNMFVFEDLLTLEDDAIQKITQEIDTPTLTMALKNAPEEILNKFLDNMSQRAKAKFDEEIEMLTKVKLKDMEKSQRAILDKTQEMLEDGTIEREEEE